MENETKKSSSALNHKTHLLKFLQSMGSMFVEQLLNSNSSDFPFVCKAIFQSLSPLCKNFVMKIIFVDGSFIESDVSDRKITKFVEELTSIGLMSSGDGKFALNNHFRQGLWKMISSPIDPWTESNEVEMVLSERLVESDYWDKWSGILNFVMELSSVPPHPKVVQVLKDYLRIIDHNENTNKYRLAGNGYEFMLMNNASQLWTIVLKILEMSPSIAGECVGFLSSMSYAQPYRKYSVSHLSKGQRVLLSFLVQLGVVYIDPTESPISSFYLSKQAVNILFPVGSKELNSQDSLLTSSLSTTPMKIIVETNLQVIAYASNELHIKLLSLFVDIRLRLPNMVMGEITREKIKEAYARGISPDQIVHFLASNSHEITHNQQGIMSAIPPNVIDELFLWRSEEHEIERKPCVLVQLDPDSFPTRRFEELKKNAIKSGGCLWVDPQPLSMKIIVTSATYEAIFRDAIRDM